MDDIIIFLDYTLGTMASLLTHRTEGFQGQIKQVIPRPFLKTISTLPLISELYPTDIGWYPRAKFHYRNRPEGAPESILLYCVAGKGSYRFETNEGTLYKNQALLIPAGVPHLYEADEKSPWSIYFLHFSGVHSDFHQKIRSDRSRQIPVALKIKPSIEAHFHQIFTLLKKGLSTANLLQSAQITRLLLTTLFYQNPTFTPGTTPSINRDFTFVIDFMKRHLTQNLTLDELAEKASLSPPRFITLFSQQTGFPPVTYHIRLRMQNACHLLDTTDQSIQNIAQATGYTDPYYFSRLFRQYMGTSPRGYRKMISG